MPATYTVRIERRLSADELTARLVQGIWGGNKRFAPHTVKTLTVTQKRGEKVGDTFARAYVEGQAAAGPDHDVFVERV